MNSRSTPVQHKGEHKTNPAICNLPSPHFADELTPVPENVSHYVAREAVKRMDELALIGYPILDPATRSVYEVVIRQVAEGVVDS